MTLRKLTHEMTAMKLWPPFCNCLEVTDTLASHSEQLPKFFLDPVWTPDLEGVLLQ